MSGLTGALFRMVGGEALEVRRPDGRRSVVVRYDEQHARGDDGRLVAGLTTGDYEIATGSMDNLLGQRVVGSVHVSPETGGGSRAWAAERVSERVRSLLAVSA